MSLKKSIKNFILSVAPLRKAARRMVYSSQRSEYVKAAKDVATDECLIAFCTFDGRDYSDSPKAVYDFVCPPKASSQPQGGMAPGIFYDLGTLTGAVTISLAAPSDASIANEWRFCFVTGSTVPTITWPQGITYVQGNVEFDSNNKPVLEADTRYECNIQEGALIIDSFLTW